MGLLNISRGLSILEITFWLIISGFILANGFLIYNKMLRSIQIKNTYSRMSAIADAADEYFSINHKLPCPARGNLSSTKSGVGWEVQFVDENGELKKNVDYVHCNIECTDTIFNNGGIICKKNAIIGVVPNNVNPGMSENTKDSIMYDSWGYKIFYIIDKRFTDKDFVDKLFFDNTIDSNNFNIKIIDSFNENIADNSKFNGVIYLLASSGIDGLGAWDFHGNLKLKCTDIDEDQRKQRNICAYMDVNADTDEISFVDRNASLKFVDQYNDLLLWRVSNIMY